jgi:thiosulfate dehydrogenase [quinone] large subunit
LAVQIIIGYEWLASGITKIASGNFVSGMAADLKTTADSAPHFYKDFLTGTVIPNARTFAVLIEIGELLVGIALIAGSIVWLARWSRLSDPARMGVLGALMLAALGGIFMAVNFHLAAGGNHPWLIPKEGFDETMDLDAMLVLVQGAYLVFCGYLLVKIRREHQTTAVPETTVISEPTAVPAEVPQGAVSVPS